MKRKIVNPNKVMTTIGVSWGAFLVALTGMAGLWYFFYWITLRWVPGGLAYFKIGIWVAGIIGVLMLVFNEWLVKTVMSAGKIHRRGQCPKLWGAVERAKPRNFPMPRIYVTGDRGMNAFAFGLGFRHMSAIGATDGIIDGLSQKELDAVIAHEMSHILNKDMLVSIMMTISVLMAVFVGWGMMRLGPFTAGRSRGGGAWAMIGIAILGVVIYGFGRLFGVFLQLFVSRQREYAADARACNIVGDNEPLYNALSKIFKRSQIGVPWSRGLVGPLCTVDPGSDLFSTHPDPHKRLQAIADLALQ